MEHITVEYYRAGTPYLSPEAIEEIIQSRGTVKNACREMANRYSTSTRRIYEIWKRHAEGIPLRKQQLIHSVVSSEIMSKNNTSDRKSKKRNPGSSSRSVWVSDSVNIPIKKVVEMDDLQARLAQNRKEREEAKRETKRVLDSN
ncbi:8763_t:CDS:1 [Gigaspora rosea]|nr:8763_t:CDS:1 [Gigaspora rosea]